MGLPNYEPGGRTFESYRARHKPKVYSETIGYGLFREHR